MKMLSSDVSSVVKSKPPNRAEYSLYLKDELTQILSWAVPIWSEPLDLGAVDGKGQLLNHRMADIAHLFDSCFMQQPQAV